MKRPFKTLAAQRVELLEVSRRVADAIAAAVVPVETELLAQYAEPIVVHLVLLGILNSSAAFAAARYFDQPYREAACVRLQVGLQDAMEDLLTEGSRPLPSPAAPWWSGRSGRA